MGFTCKKRRKVKQVLFMTIISFSFVFLLSACLEKEDHRSPVKGVSKEVYEQLVEHYSFLPTQIGIILGEVEAKEERANWYKNHDLMDKAFAYTKEHNDIEHELWVFPNPIMYEYKENPDDFNDTEQSYLEKMEDFMKAVSYVDEDYGQLKEELKKELKISDEDNIFDVNIIDQ